MECSAADAVKITYTRDDDGNWTETRTCPGGGGIGSFESVGLGKNFNPIGAVLGAWGRATAQGYAAAWSGTAPPAGGGTGYLLGLASQALGVRAPVSGSGVANPVPVTLARVVPVGVPTTSIGAPGAADVFVTSAWAVRGLNASQIAQRLTIRASSTGFNVFEFPTSSISSIASPYNRTNLGFISGGRTAGGAPEFIIPNGPFPPGTTRWVAY